MDESWYRPRAGNAEALGRGLRALVLAVACAATAGAGATPVRSQRELAPAVPTFGPNDRAGFEVVWVGLYDVAEIRRIEDFKAPAQSRGLVVGETAPLQSGEGTTIPVTLGTNFGIAFTFSAAKPHEEVDYRAVWRFPGQGITNPDSAMSYTEYQSAPSLCQGGVCVYGWSFSEPWEMVPGTWILELWRGTTKLHQQFFEVVPADDGGAAGASTGAVTGR